MKKISISNFITKIPSWLVESTAVLALLVVMGLFARSHDPGFAQIHLHPYWIVVLLISARYGFGGGLFAGSLTACTYLYFLFETFPTRLELEKAAEAGSLWTPIAFFVAGIAMGEVRQLYIQRERNLQEKYDETKRELKKVSKSYQGSEKARHILEGRIVGQATTIKTLYDSARKLESLDPPKVYEGCLDILQNRLQVEKSSLYLLEDDHYVLKSSRGWEQGSAAEGKIPVGQSLMDLMFRERRVLTVREILSFRDTSKYMEKFGETLAMIPLCDVKGNPIGCINIEKIDFLALNQANLELMQLVVDWTGQTLETIRRFQALQSRVVFDEAEKIYTYPYFKASLESEYLRAKTFNQPLCVSLVKLEGYGFLEGEAQQTARRTLMTMMHRHLKKTDRIFQYRFQGTYAVISPARGHEELQADLAQVAHEMKSINVKIATSVVGHHPDMEKAEELVQESYQKI